MKKILIKYIGIAFIGLVISSCEKIDNVADLGSSKGVVAEVYMENLNPSYSTGEIIEVPISYWLEGKKFKQLSMNHRYDSLATVKIKKVANLNYQYENDFSGETMELELFKNEDHDPAYWTPIEYAYTFKSKYTVDSSLEKQSYTQRNTDAVDFANMLNDEFYDEFYNDLAYGMSQEQLNTLIVDEYSIVSQEMFDTYYDEFGYLVIYEDEGGNIVNYGADSIVADLAQIPQEDMFGEDYSMILKNQITLQYWIENNESLIGKSDYRSFTVK